MNNLEQINCESHNLNKQNILSIEDAYEIYETTLNDNLKFYLNESKIYHMHKYIDFEQLDRLYLINKENIKYILDSFIEKLKDKNFTKKYDLEYDDIDKNEIINAIKNLNLENINYKKVFSLIYNISEISDQFVIDVLNEKSKVISYYLLKNNSFFHCLYSYYDIKRLIEKEENNEILVIVPTDLLSTISDIDILDEAIIYYILYIQGNYQSELFYETNNYNLEDYKIRIET